MRLSRACILVCCIAALVAGGIWSFDWQAAKHPPEESFQLEARAATALVANHPIVFPSRVNESVLRWSLVERIETAPEIVLFGSSHGLQVASDNFGKHRFLNLSISGAMLADYLVSTEILTRREKRPVVWVVMVDAWLFNPDVDFQTWRARAMELRRMETTLSELSSPALYPLFRDRVDYYLSTRRKPEYSLDPLLRAFDRLARRQFDNVVVPDHDFQATIMEPDGALQPSSDKQQITSDAVRSLALRQYSYSGDRHRYGNYSKVDEDLWKLFERWIQFLHRDNSRVVFVLSPYHPAIYPKILNHPQNQLRGIETRTHELARKLGIPVIGSYDPDAVGVTESDFYDGDHLRESGLTRLFDKALPETTKGL